MFKRRRPKTFLRHARNLFWPDIGLWRWGRYWYYRLVRIQTTPHEIARGVASGVAVSLTPLIGFHVLAAILVAKLVKGNYLAAIIGSLIGNPLTLPVFLTWEFTISEMLIGPSKEVLLYDLDWQLLLSDPLMIGQSWLNTVMYGMVGGIPLALVFGSLSYWIVFLLVLKYKHIKP